MKVIGACAAAGAGLHPFAFEEKHMERTIKPETLKDELAGKLTSRRAPCQPTCDARQRAAARRASWQDPEQLAEWADSLPKDQDIVLYCVRGGSVSNSVVDALQAKGLKARFIEGGIEGWKAAGGEVVGSNEMDHPRTPQDRPHRLPLADRPLHRSGSRVSLRACRRRAGHREGNRRHSLRHPGRGIRPSRRTVQLRRLPGQTRYQ